MPFFAPVPWPKHEIFNFVDIVVKRLDKIKFQKCVYGFKSDKKCAWGKKSKIKNKRKQYPMFFFFFHHRFHSIRRGETFHPNPGFTSKQKLTKLLRFLQLRKNYNLEKEKK
jgi:hypothetical protein